MDDFVGERIKDAPLGAAGVLEFVEQPVVMATVETVVEITPPGVLRAVGKEEGDIGKGECSGLAHSAVIDGLVTGQQGVESAGRVELRLDFEFDQRPAEIFAEFGETSPEVEAVFDFATDGNVDFAGSGILAVAGELSGEKFFQLFIHAARRTMGESEIEPRVPLVFCFGAEVGMSRGHFLAQSADGILHRAGGEYTIVAGPDAGRISPRDAGRCIKIILLEAGCGGFDRAEN